MSDLLSVAWPSDRLHEAVETLARRAGLVGGNIVFEGGANAGVGESIEGIATALGVEVEPAETPYDELDDLVRGCAPALIRIGSEAEPRFLPVVRSGRRGVFIITKDLEIRSVDPEELRATLAAAVERPVAGEIEALLDRTAVSAKRRERARRALLRERIGARRVGGCWLLRLPPGADFLAQIQRERLPRHFVRMAAAHAAQYLLWIVAWWLLGNGALDGHLDAGWLTAWGLLLATIVPLRLLALWSQGVLSIGAGMLLKRRLLAGALGLEPESVRRHGAGEMLGRVIESESVESLALGGGFLALVSVVEIVFAGAVLALGVSGWLLPVLLAAWSLLALWLVRRYWRARREWTDARLGLTHDLVERMIGHRTRLAQEPPEQWHTGEDADVERYLETSRRMDRAAALLVGLVPRGWLLVGFLGLVPAFVAGRADPVSLAVGVGGLLLAYTALGRLALGSAHLAGAAIAWRQVAPLFAAAETRPAAGLVLHDAGEASAETNGQASDAPIVEADDLVFRYRPQGEPVLRGCTLRIGEGERLLLEGASGGGKSTLASILAGLRLPESGLLLLRGVDRRSLGDAGWRRAVVSAPQFHENHVLMGTFAFNLLMGRGWPPTERDFAEAEELCRALGLGDLLDRMPAGLLQIVGETGWQLSHGERSRLYIARALLQRARLIVLDESFGALDPETLRRTLGCVLDRAPALLVIAHP